MFSSVEIELEIAWNKRELVVIFPESIVQVIALVQNHAPSYCRRRSLKILEYIKQQISIVYW
jgi:hypothetical protein